ncbi:MAG TPA: FHA domain-containing protein [Verrucomicrobiae bacterium]|nr:FHA domain-containing protein [Verrucomicrobiae bacterium]
MIQLESLSGTTAGTKWSPRRFPFRVGRADDADVQINAPGVWDQHFIVELDPAAGFLIQPQGEALITVNSHAVKRSVLRNGDHIQFGAASLRFWLAQAPQKSLSSRESFFWAIMAAVVAAQFWMIYSLID